MGQRIRNTSNEEVHPEWLFGRNPKAIEGQAARGQNELINSSQLPVDVRGKEILEEAGVKFGKPLLDDPLFCIAELPSGWSKRATDHSMWSELIDDKGVVRAHIFYKAAFYDRRADMTVVAE